METLNPNQKAQSYNKAFRHVGPLFVQGNQARNDQNKLYFLLTEKQICFG